MLEAVLAGIVAGYAIAIPVGAIAVLIIHTGLTRGLRPGLAAGAGAASADGIYAAAAAVGGLALAGLIQPLIVPLRIAAGVVLVGLGLRGLWALRGPRDALVATGSERERSAGRTYLSLLGLTLLNPMTVIYFVALTVGLPFLGGSWSGWPSRWPPSSPRSLGRACWRSWASSLGADRATACAARRSCSATC